MNDDERDEILIRVDERTKRIDDALSNLRDDISENEQDIDAVEEKVTSNSTDIKTGKGILAGLATLTSALLAKVAGLIQF